MAKATFSDVLREAGLDEPDAYLLFRMSSEAELHAFAQAKVAAAAGWLRRKITAAVYDDVSDADFTAAVTQAETWAAAILLAKVIEARKVYGTHWAVDSEDSTGYANLIEQWERLLTEFLLELEEEAEGDERPFAMPAMALTAGVDRSAVPVFTDLLQDDLDLARGLIGAEALS